MKMQYKDIPKDDFPIDGRYKIECKNCKKVNKVGYTLVKFALEKQENIKISPNENILVTDELILLCPKCKSKNIQWTKESMKRMIAERL